MHWHALHTSNDAPAYVARFRVGYKMYFCGYKLLHNNLTEHHTTFYPKLQCGGARVTRLNDTPDFRPYHFCPQIRRDTIYHMDCFDPAVTSFDDVRKVSVFDEI